VQEEKHKQVFSFLLRLCDIFTETIEQKLFFLDNWCNDTFNFGFYLWIVEDIRINHRNLFKTQFLVESSSYVVAQFADKIVLEIIASKIEFLPLWVDLYM
jgi:hypothetical protein